MLVRCKMRKAIRFFVAIHPLRAPLPEEARAEGESLRIILIYERLRSVLSKAIDGEMILFISAILMYERLRYN